MKLNRRQFVAGSTGVLAMPACANQRAGKTFAPEQFGAVGDGRRDDHAAFARLAASVNAAGGGTIVLRRNAVYRIDRFAEAGSADPNVVFDGCDGLTFEGNGAAISVRGDLHRAAQATRGLNGLFLRECGNVAIRNLELNGNVDRMTRAGGLTEPPSHGLHFQGCRDVLVERVTARHFAGDGMYVRESVRTGRSGTRAASRDFTVRDSRFLFNARQGLSVIQLRGATFENCDFSHTGFVDAAGTIGPYGHHAPGAGVDVEPNRSPYSSEPVDVLTGLVRFKACKMVGNRGAAFLAAHYRGGRHNIEEIWLESCELECSQGTPSRYGFIFDLRGGLVANCRLQMFDKTAFLGWSPESDASPRFVGNTVLGRNSDPKTPFFELRRTRGAPLIEGNRFIGEHRRHKPASFYRSWLVLFDNPNAIVRENLFDLPAAAYPPGARGSWMPAILANVRLMDRNRYQTDLPGSAAPAGRRGFGVMYGATTMARNELFRGANPGPQDTVQPVELKTGRAWNHDTRNPWSR